jgi:lysophospholipase L1-like esterase
MTNTARKLLLGLLGGGSASVPAITWLFRDLFTTDAAAGNLNGTSAEPGPGTRTAEDTNDRYSITGGQMVRSAGAHFSAWTDPQLYTADVANETGLAFYTAIRLSTLVNANGFIGADNKVTANPADLLANFLEFNQVQPISNGSTITTSLEWGVESGADMVIPVPVEMAVISRNPGAIFLQRVKAGQWRVVWVDSATASASLMLRTNDIGRPFWLDEWGISNDLPAVWSDRFGIATARTATTANGSTSTAEVNALIEHTITAATGVTQELMVRRTDDNNCIIIRMSQAGSTIKIIEVAAGSETEKASAAQTWTNATAYRIVVTVDGYSVCAYVGTTYKATWTSARNTPTATGVKVSHAGSELVTWPLNVTLAMGSAVAEKTFWTLGDSKTHGQGDDTSPYAAGQNGYQYRLATALSGATGSRWYEHPRRNGRASYGVNAAGGSMVGAIDADLSIRYPNPDFILVNLGVNDGTTMNGDAAQWVTDYQYILDTLHVWAPNARIGVARPASNSGDWSAMDDTRIPEVIAGRSWAFLGPDERTVLGANWATLTVDGIHPSPAGYDAMAAAWKTAMGY